LYTHLFLFDLRIVLFLILWFNSLPDSIGILVDNEVAAPVDSVPWADNLPSSSIQWSEILVNEMLSASNTDDAKARASRVLEVFERAMTSRIGAEAHQSFQKVIDFPSLFSSNLCH
jgi:hypothetical protein